MVRDLEPEIRRSMHVIAKEEVALEQLNTQINTSQTKADKDKGDILRLQADLGQNHAVYRYASRKFTSDEVKRDLEVDARLQVHRVEIAVHDLAR